MHETPDLGSASEHLLSRLEGASLADAANAVTAATGAQRLLLDAERSGSEKEKSQLEQEKLRHENRTARKREQSERRKDYITLFTPLISFITFAATIVFQGIQFKASEDQKFQEAMRAEYRADTARWDAALKSISDTTKLSPVVMQLQPFLNNPQFGGLARAEAFHLAVSGNDPALFDDIVGNVFSPPDLDPATGVVAIDRAVYARGSQVFTKSYNPRTHANNLRKLSSGEKALYRYSDAAFNQLSAAIAYALKMPRPAGQVPDLDNTYLRLVDLSGANLSKSSLRSAIWASVDLKDADLSEIHDFAGLFLSQTPWWEARRISPDLLSYLRQAFPCGAENKFGYGSSTSKHFTHKQCTEAITRLESKPS